MGGKPKEKMKKETDKKNERKVKSGWQTEKERERKWKEEDRPEQI